MAARQKEVTRDVTACSGRAQQLVTVLRKMIEQLGEKRR
jgi:hypothetical protein